MEWVETTGKTVEEAKEMALDQLGVDEADAEFEVLEEPKVGLFGRLRGDARVRARVRPQAPPPKLERRDRRRSGGRDKERQRPGGRDDAPATAAPTTDRSPRAGVNRRPRGGARATTEGAAVQESRDRAERARPELSPAQVEEQIGTVRTFLEGLLDAFGADGEVTIGRGDDGAIEAAITGEDLGLLIGPKAATLEALQELARRALQARHEDTARLRVDVAGYREKRREALARFARKVADQVLASGEPAALEPMGAADRKVVHDTCNEIEGVSTSSAGEEPRRHVVISPA